MTEAPGAYVSSGHLFFRLRDGATLLCTCIAEPYASLVVEACIGPPKAKRGRPRLDEKRKDRPKPWLECVPPMSERTWYRRKAEEKS